MKSTEKRSSCATAVFGKNMIVMTVVLTMLSACSPSNKPSGEAKQDPSKTDISSSLKGGQKDAGIGLDQHEIADKDSNDKDKLDKNASDKVDADKTVSTSSSGKAKEPESSSATEKKDSNSNSRVANSGKVNINLADLPSDVPICTVAGIEIKVGDYKRTLRIQQIQNNQAILTDPNTKEKLLQEAKARGIGLSQQEKNKLLEAAHRQKGQDQKQFQDFLKQTKLTQKQFDDNILDTGLAFRTSDSIIEEKLLPDLVNRALLSQAAEEAGGEKEAMNKYLAFKHTRQYDALLEQTGLSTDALREELLQTELAKMQVAKLESQAKVSNADIHKLYDLNKKQLKHDERIRLSTILIICPENDIGPIASVRNQVLRANPKLSGKELDATVVKVMDQQKQKALECLQKAKAGADFAKLANESSNEPETQVKKNGGDLGFIERKNVIPALGDLVWSLKVGEVLPQIVKSELGFNVYKVTGKDKAGDFKYDELKPKLELLARQAKFQQVMAEWLDHRRRVVRVEFSPKFLAIANQSSK